jgi:hypothetical protein
MQRTIGWLYLLHLNQRLGREGRNGAEHYLGWTPRAELLERLRAHGTSSGARMLEVARQRGIGWHVGMVARGTPGDERRLKRYGHHDELCWTCAARAGRPPRPPHPPRPSPPRPAPELGGLWVLQGGIFVEQAALPAPLQGFMEAIIPPF